MGPLRQTLLKTTLFVIGSLVLALIVTFFLHRAPLAVVAQWKQPTTIHYDSFDPYYLSVVEADIDWRGFPFQTERNYLIYVGRDSGTPQYGHFVKFSFHPESDAIEDHIRRSTVEWTDDGVIFAAASGHRLLIPRKMFLGGR